MHEPTTISAELLAIGQRLGFETLETRGSDSLDFRDIAVWMARQALIEAYEAAEGKS